MGACSSKPKTTEFEGSIEPRKPTDVAADQPHETERSLENLADDHSKEAPAKVGERGEARHVSTEAVQTTPQPDSCKDEGPSKEVLSRSAEGTSEGQNDVLGEKVVVPDGVSDEVVQKNELGVGVENSTSVNVNGADAKICEDKAVVSEETGGYQGDAAYVDKTVPPDEEKAAETPEKRNIIVPEEDASSMLDPAESAGVESPITGVVQTVEPMKDLTNEEDVSKNVTTESVVVGAYEDSQDDSKVGAESPATGAGDVDVGAMATILAVAREVPREGIEASGVEILAPTSAVDTLAPAEADPVKNGDEGTSQPQGEAPSDAVVNLFPASKIDAEECPTDTKAADVPLDECVVNQTEGIHASAVGDGGSADTMETETPKKIESADSEVSIIESKIEDALEESVKDKDGQMSDGQSHALAAEMNGDRGPTGESMSEREERSDQIQEPTGEAEKEAAHKLHVEHTASGDAPFEDASDAPLKSEAGKSIESGHVPS